MINNIRFILGLSVFLIGSLGCGSTSPSSSSSAPERSLPRPPSDMFIPSPTREVSLLSDEQILKIGYDGGSSLSGGGFYDPHKPINMIRPAMPAKKAGIIKDGIYRLRHTLFEAAEKVVRGPQADKFEELFSREREEKKIYGVLHVSQKGQRIVEYKFGTDNIITKEEFESDGQGSLKSRESQNCQRAYFTKAEDIAMSPAKGSIEISEYCPGQPDDVYARNSIRNHHELWQYIYEPYPEL
jgi:hypothetical protein